MGSKRDADRTLGYPTRKDTEVKLPRQTQVKNKTPAPIQSTAEHLIREARDSQVAEFRPPKQKLTDSTELRDYRLRQREEYEDLIRRMRWNTGVWIKYAQWEESVNEFNSARRVWERALEVDYRNHTLWCKQIFERWMHWMPDHEGWLSYIKFELRYNEVQRARHIFERLVQCHPYNLSAWINFADFEMKMGEVDRARNVYERAVEIFLADDHDEAEQLFVAFAEFEEMGCKETDRARCIYKFALDRMPKGRAEDLHRKFLAFEKQYGDREGIEDAIAGKMRLQYEDGVRKNPMNYDTCFDYIRLEESVGNQERVREVYERAIANVPPAEGETILAEIYLLVEMDAGDMERTRDVYRECLKLIPHKKFSFAKIWLLAAQFEIRQLNLSGARQILGNAIGKAPKDKIYKNYIEMELRLGNIDRCRKLYQKYLEWSPENCYAWSKYAELEKSLDETERARAIFELAIAQPALDLPELLWKAYIDFEISQGEYARTRALYERLLDRTKHLNVWISYVKFEASAMSEDGGNPDTSKDLRVFEEAINYYRTSVPELKEERAMLLEEWLNMESNFGELGDVSLVQTKLPKKLKKRRQNASYDGLSAGYEEYIDYLLPEESKTTNLEILEAAYNWKKQKIVSHDE
ncbi:hypothetical protein WN944_000292 [Citrus x changshan-huyou]|uniref:Pre-mRNA-splicing factor Syf1/CRNKL1-like C-terminal HAT-repeats domain-containing protein n=1 Tax=Citrus x changshan-huyou TaxID=2935761 RepID=A0AAP0QTP3_9ROSI